MMTPGLPTLITYRPRSTTRKIILHESHTPASVGDATALLRAQGRANGLLEVGYHYVIEANGCVVNTRAWETVGSHCPGENHDSIGICLTGDEDTDWWGVERSPQMMALHQLYQTLYRWVGQRLPVVGHEEVLRGRRRHDQHPCPSFNMAQMRKFLGAIDYGHGTTEEPLTASA